MKSKSILLLILCCISSVSFAQLELMHGHDTNGSGDIRVLIVFAELDCTPCPNSTLCGSESTLWPEGALPVNVEDWILPELLDDETPEQGEVTKFYHAASLGNLKVTGDFFHAPVRVSCLDYASSNDQGRAAVFNQLNAEIAGGNTDFQSTYLGGFSSWGDFDLISLEGNHGNDKTLGPNGSVDCVAIIWRNIPSASDFGFTSTGVAPMLQMADDNIGANVRVIGNWGDRRGDDYPLFIAEYLHALYGGNNWHMGGGASRHTFMGYTGTHGLAAQTWGASQMANAWDRWALNWRPFDWDYDLPGAANFRIRATSADGTTAVNTDLLTPCQAEQTFILRDFYKTGDAIRIRLPHLDFPISNDHDIKSQYLWLENHQQLSEYDRSKGGACGEWGTGLYAYFQIGKDVSTSATSNLGEIYPEHLGGSLDDRARESNFLASWLFPLTAEGSYDYDYRIDLMGEDMNNTTCIWNNEYLPIETDSDNTLPNPLTGASELFNLMTDVDGNGSLEGLNANPLDFIFISGSAEINNGSTSPEFNLFKWGDQADAFRLNEKNKIAIGRNPSAAPVYTHMSGVDMRENTDAGQPNKVYENRTIYLNGISVEIIEEIANADVTDENGNPSIDLKIRVRWDDYLVDQDTRWCGNIVLQQDDDDVCSDWQSRIVIDDDKEILLDQGRTPTKYVGDQQVDGSFLFAENTTLTISDGTQLHLRDTARIRVKNNSTLIIEEGAEVLLEQHACIVVEETGTLYLKGNNINLIGDNSVIILKGTLKTDDDVDFTFTGPGFIDVHPSHQIDMGLNSDFVIERPITSDQERFMRLRDNTVLGLSDRELRLRYGKVIYGENAQIGVTDGGIVAVGTIFEGNNNAIGLRGVDLDDCQINFNEFYTMERGIDLYGNNTVPVIKSI